MVFTFLKLIVFKNKSEFINVAVFVLFCLMVTKPYYGAISFLVKY